ncbi:MAG: hypothetical protein GOU99_02050 [Candidatus Altiarchaeota archaeon]|nr:hypothetical protein [Candidatus Altiarchaeota archaeon]
MIKLETIENLLMVSISLIFVGGFIAIGLLARIPSTDVLLVVLGFLGIASLLLIAMLVARIYQEVYSISKLIKKNQLK